MSEHNITVEGGSSIRLKTAGKYCDRDIVVTAGGGGDTTIEDSLINRTLTEYTNIRLTTIGNYAFSGCSKLVDVYLPEVTKVGQYAFEGCRMTEITSSNFPSLTTMDQNSFRSCNSATYVNLPKVTTIPAYAFNTCQYLAEVRFDKATATGNRSFVANYRLKKAILPAMQSIEGLTFYQCYSLTALILASEKLCALKNTNAFQDAYHFVGKANATYNPDGATDGYIYVPDELVDSYKTATNWSTYAAQIKPISELEV